jgi:hypothetical protein
VTWSWSSPVRRCSGPDDYLAATWIPGLKTQRGLRSIIGSIGDLMGGRDIPYARVMEATFESLGDVMAVLESPSGQVEKQALQRLGATTLLYETREF